jgi:dolichol-phosphate mannosyltransferase
MREAENLPTLFAQLHDALDEMVSDLEILVVDTPTGDGTEALCAKHGARYIGDPAMGFADALKTGFKAAKNDYILTMDADGSHDPIYIRRMLRYRDKADLIINSRYAPQGGQETTLFRYATSRILNWYLGIVCSMPIRDLSGGFKLYRRDIFDHLELKSRGFEIQTELGIRVYGHGYKVMELPFCYIPRVAGRSKAAILKYGMAFLVRSLQLRSYRNSILFCDYYERAFRSRIPMQRYWHRVRYDTILSMLQPSASTLDVGCGTGRITMAFPRVVSLDVNEKVLRYLAHYERKLVRGSAMALPFRDASFETVYACELIEHCPPFETVYRELARVLKPGGRCLIVTADYGGFLWPKLYGIYKAVLSPENSYLHVSQHTRESVEKGMTNQGLKLVETRRTFGSLLYLLFEKPATAD